MWEYFVQVMEGIGLIAIISIPILEFLGIKKFNDSYMGEKGKNLATKEDVEKLNSLVEDIKTSHKNKQYRYEHMYDIKLVTIQESLNILDEYFSWLFNDEKRIPVRNNITKDELTVKVRQCYNKLVLTSESKDLPENFLFILLDTTGDKMEQYNTYRNLARNEMGIYSDIELSREHVFISKISTEALENI